MTITPVNGYDPALQTPPAESTQTLVSTFAPYIQDLLAYGKEEGKGSLVRTKKTINDTQDILSKIESYTWFSEKNETLAHTAFTGALKAAQENRAGLVRFTLQALIDLYHADRADHIAYLLHTEQPILIDSIPLNPPGEAITPLHYFERTIDPLASWESGTPYSILPEVVTIITQELPDEMHIVKYFERPANLLLDPIIYAQYGPWYVKVAEWI